MSFPELLANAEPVEGGFRVAIPPEWHQGRTAYGGLNAALALEAAMRVGGEGLPPLRSVQNAMMAPLYGEVEVRAQVHRRGKNATWISAEVEGEKGIGLISNMVFMGPVENSLQIDRLPPPANLIPVEEAKEQVFGKHTPVFLKNNFEVRFATPRVKERQPEFFWWVRACERDAIDPMVELLLCADAAPPGVLPLLSPTTPVSTMHWQVNLLTPRPQTRDGWWLLLGAGDFADRGCTTQREAIWNADGQAMLAGIQSIALFG